MTFKRIGILLVLILALFLPGKRIITAHAQSGIQVTNSQADTLFPKSVTFSADIQSSAEIKSIVLEYGVDQLTCGTVVAKAYPDFQPAAQVSVKWTWEMLQSGSLPPGATIWWRWKVADTAGNLQVSDQQTIIWLDSQYAWQVINGGNINLHWYSPADQSFGNTLHTAAVSALTRLAADIGLKAESPIDLYIYASAADMRNAILYEPGWTGGQAFPANDIVIIGISADSPAQIEWGKTTEAHELTHVLVGHFTFSCLGFIPNWIDEGIAMYGEGGLESASQAAFDTAVTSDTLMSVRTLSGGFPEASDKADISYSESYSLVNFLIQNFGKDKFMSLLGDLRNGATIDAALQSGYGFNVDGFEDAWRAAIHAEPRALDANATATLMPTIVPTFMPFSGVPVAPATPWSGPTIVPTTVPGSSPIPDIGPANPTPIPGIGLPALPWLNGNLLTWIGLCLVCAVLGVAIVIGPVIVTARRRHRRKI